MTLNSKYFQYVLEGHRGKSIAQSQLFQNLCIFGSLSGVKESDLTITGSQGEKKATEVDLLGLKIILRV